MITLKNISTIDSFKENDADFVDFVSKTNDYVIMDFDKLNDYVVFNGIDNKLVLEQIKRALQLVDKLNNQGINPISFDKDDYLNKTKGDYDCFDSVMSATELPIIQMSKRVHPLYELIKDYDIEMLKYKLSHIDEDGNSIIFKDKQIKSSDLERLVRIINFYDDHIVRLLIDDPYFSVNNNYLFYKDYAEKLITIWNDDYYRESIINYLFDKGNKYIFGNLNDQQKNRIIEDAKDVSEQTKKDKKNVVIPYYFYDDFAQYNPSMFKRTISEQLFDIVTKYVTREEFKNDIVKIRTLDRFVIK